MTKDGRSYEPIEDADLTRLSRIARRDREQFFEGRPEYRDRILSVAPLPRRWAPLRRPGFGGKATHGVKDFDVWTFFAAIPGRHPLHHR